MKPHLEAVLTTRMTLPFRLERGKGLPVSDIFFLLVSYWGIMAEGGKGRGAYCRLVQSRRMWSRTTWFWCLEVGFAHVEVDS